MDEKRAEEKLRGILHVQWKLIPTTSVDGAVSSIMKNIIKPILDNQISIKESDCTCWGDHNGFSVNPECIIHGKR